MAERVRIRRLPHGSGLPLPERASTGSAGFDLRAALPDELWLAPGERFLMPTGFAWEIPPGYEGQVRPRSGLAVRHGITVLNAPGTVDSDYRGEVSVPLINLGEEPVRIARGDRIAQLVVAPVAAVELEETAELSATGRGNGGFGSSGVG
ncbi:MAG: dUTP diphosphatase [Thermoanaerobaculia bacterium]